MKAIKIISLIILILLTAFSCKDDGVTPPELKPGRRDYTWTVDTLKPPSPNQTVPFYITALWGSSPNDVWAVCRGWSSQILLWHYEGNKWYLNSQQLGRDLNAILGFAQNDVWIGDAENSIWHFDGGSWLKAKNLELPGFDRVAVLHFCGISSNNIYAVGFADQFNGGTEYKGVLLHYNGIDWDFVHIPDIRAGFYLVFRKASTGELVIYGTNVDNGFLEKLFVYNGKDIYEIYSDFEEPIVGEMNGEVYVTIRGKIYKYNNGQLNLWKEFPGTSFYAFGGGRSENDFFGVGTEGLFHFNGTDLKLIFETFPKNIYLYQVFIFEKDIFISAYDEDNNLNLIIRGTLN